MRDLGVGLLPGVPEAGLALLATASGPARDFKQGAISTTWQGDPHPSQESPGLNFLASHNKSWTFKNMCKGGAKLSHLDLLGVHAGTSLATWQGNPLPSRASPEPSLYCALVSHLVEMSHPGSAAALFRQGFEVPAPMLSCWVGLDYQPHGLLYSDDAQEL